jgi:hypothetical protein
MAGHVPMEAERGIHFILFVHPCYLPISMPQFFCFHDLKLQNQIPQHPSPQCPRQHGRCRSQLPLALAKSMSFADRILILQLTGVDATTNSAIFKTCVTEASWLTTR